ncbi:type VII secretion integral membrane protein EccD [Mycolicibacterium arenosum]|uniref:Type VII secretion integral membrane protein EccD n=1 Tax=Mycolicibacterium arenosum TaxID=2952157 RepID=A0ABT1LXE0_9MYCO|nr:type VII secretion integral membrane protein EccD [Mycolicibacterium sp. CAU 1645]MCP9271568.1 type VII secretion integral membrane protein EccD [Mycolicibacterium sp. CAU 1645]
MTMTAPAPPGVDTEVVTEPELSRVSVLVGETLLDVGLPADAPVSAIVGDVIGLANAQASLASGGSGAVYDDTDGRWTLARVGLQPFEPSRSLRDVGVVDGDLLLVREVGTPTAPALFDDVDAYAQGDDQVRGFPIIALCVVGSAVASVLLALGTPTPTPSVATVAVVLGVLGLAVVCLLRHRGLAGPRDAMWLSAAALPPILAGSLFVIPGGTELTSLPMAVAITALAALLMVLVADTGRALCTGLVGVALVGAPAVVFLLLWHPPIRSVAALAAMAAVVAIYLAPRITILLSRVPIPPVPTAGEPLDDIDTQGGTTVEGVNAVGRQVIPTEHDMLDRVGRANRYLTGILGAATVVAVTGSYFAVDISNGFFWQGTAFALTVAVVLCLRGRSHHELQQAGMLIGGGMMCALAVIVKTATFLPGWQVNAAAMLVALSVVVAMCGLAAPRIAFSPVMRRQVELAEYLAIGMLFPLCFWVTRLYAFFRELQI